MHPGKSFDKLLNLVEMTHQLACDPEARGCGKLNCIHHFLSAQPHIFMTGELFISFISFAIYSLAECSNLNRHATFILGSCEMLNAVHVFSFCSSWLAE